MSGTLRGDIWGLSFAATHSVITVQKIPIIVSNFSLLIFFKAN